MEVSLVIVNTVILLLSLPVIHGKGNNVIDDMALNESSQKEVDYRMLPMQLQERNDDMQRQHWAQPSVPTDGPTIDFLMRNNKDIMDTLRRLERKIDSISDRGVLEDNDHNVREVNNKLDIILKLISGSSNKRCQNHSIEDLVSAVDSANLNLQSVAKDFNKVMINSRLSTQSLRKMTEIVQDIDARIRSATVSPRQFPYDVPNYGFSDNYKTNLDKNIRIGYGLHRQLPDNEQNYEYVDNEFTGASRNTNPTPTRNHKTADKVRLEPKKSNCEEIQTPISGIYQFASQYDKTNEGGRSYYKRYCEFDEAGVAWTVIQRRFANNQQLSFNKTWSEYKLGFGKLDGEFWFGNDFIHKLTSEREMELLIIFEDLYRKKDWAQYSLFRMESEKDQYKLVIDGYNGSIGDDFQYLNGQDFSTFDSRHGKHDLSCASHIGNGWWFKNCTADFPGNWLGSTSTKMMVRPKVNTINQKSYR